MPALEGGEQPAHIGVITAAGCEQVRGFGDPLIACYMRSYLVHKLLELLPTEAAELVLPPLWDTLVTFEKQVLTPCPLG